MIVDIITLKLSALNGLLGNVFPNLRAVSVDSKENLISVCFYCNGEISEDDKECCESTLDQIFADCSLVSKDGTFVGFEVSIDRLDYPKKIPLIGHWVFYRHEDTTKYVN